MCGILDEFENYNNIKFIPSSIILKGCVISSQQLFKRYKISEDLKTFCDVDLSLMKEYEPEYIYEITLNMFDFDCLSDKLDLLQIDFTKVLFFQKFKYF